MCVYKQPVWWDQETDREGRSIRSDVRKAAFEVWNNACAFSKSLLGDTTETAEIMETCVARISHYLSSHKDEAATHNITALLMVAFKNSVLNRAARLRREACIAETELIEPPTAWGSLETIEIQIDLEKLVRRLRPRSRTILVLRDAGYEWSEIAALFRLTVPAVKKRFHRDLRDAQNQLAGNAAAWTRKARE